jgi:plastocyanin
MRIAPVIATAIAIAAPASASAQKSGALEGRITVTGRASSTDHSRVVVAIQAPARAPLPAGHATVHQKDQTFRPDLTVVTRNAVIDFPNDDKIFHNVFSLSRAARFDLGLYKSGSSKSVTFRRAGVVDIYCNIHPNMVSQIKVVDTPHYAVTTADGRFRIAGVPPGTYPVSAWVPWGEEVQGSVVIEAGKTARLDLRLKAGRPPKRHMRKDGTPYGRYQ